MKTDPFTDTWLFFAGEWGDLTALDDWRWVVVAAFAALLLASVVIAVREWQFDPAQRTLGHLVNWLARVLIGGMWFTNTLWKLPFFTDANGLHFWTQQEASNAAFAWHRWFVAHVLLQQSVFYALDVVVFFTEMAFAVSLILGLGVRFFGAIGVIFTAQLWLGLYRHPTEWAWTYGFLMILMGLFAVHAAGRSLGLDALLRRGVPLDVGRMAQVIRLVT